MGLLTDYFAATPGELAGVSVEHGPIPAAPPVTSAPKRTGGLFGRFGSKSEPSPTVQDPPVVEGPSIPAMSSNGIDAPRIALLDSLITGVRFAEEDWDGPATTPIREAGEDGPWIFGLRREFRDAFASLDDAREVDIAGRWAADTDWMGDTDDESVIALQEFIRDLRGLAATATASDRDLYLWVSL